MIAYRQCDRRYPYLWESTDQPAARWNSAGAGPVQYFSNTPDGAWAEFIRHEEIVDEADLLGVRRAMWAIDVPHESDDFAEPALPTDVLTGGIGSYPDCQAEAQRVELGFRPAPPRDGLTYVAFGTMPRAVGWQVVDEGRPPATLLPSVRPLV